MSMKSSMAGRAAAARPAFCLPRMLLRTAGRAYACLLRRFALPDIDPEPRAGLRYAVVDSTGRVWFLERWSGGYRLGSRPSLPWWLPIGKGPEGEVALPSVDVDLAKEEIRRMTGRSSVHFVVAGPGGRVHKGSVVRRAARLARLSEEAADG